jgi:ABC-type amino acid transport substrate-binding protein
MKNILTGISRHADRLTAALAVSLALVLCLGQAETAFAEPPAKSPIMMVGFPEFPPLSYANAQGAADGYLVHLGKELFARAGIDTRINIYPASRLFDQMTNGSIDFSMLVHNPVLDACCLYSKQAVMHEALRAYHIGNKPHIKDINGLVGKRIITIQGYSYAGLISFIKNPKNRITNEVAPTHEAAFTMLDAGRADYVLDYAGPSFKGLAAHPVRNIQFQPIGHLDIFLVLDRTYPDAERLMARLTAMVIELQREPAFRIPDEV